MSHHYSTQFITEIQGVNHFQQFNIEILNYTSLNFARPDKSTDSHTASMTAERRKLFDQLPRLNTNVNSRPPTILKQSPDHDNHDKDAYVTQTGAHVDFVPEQANDAADSNNDSSKRKHKLSQKLLRRVSAPSQGIEFYFKQSKDGGYNNHHHHHHHHHHKKILDIRPSIPAVHIEADESVEDHENESIQINVSHHNGHHHDDHNNNHNNDHNNDHNNNNTTSTNSASMSSSIASVSSITSQDPPSLSPCSSTTSIGSSVDLLSPAAINHSQAYEISKPKSKSIPAPGSLHAHSLPDLVTDPYGSEPWSPAAMFLSNFAIQTQALPDDEGQQIGEYIVGKVIGRGGFSTVKQAHTMDQSPGTMKTVAVKIVRNHPDSDDNESVQALLEREVAIWRRLDHPNIVPMLSIEENNYATFVFSEYCSGGTLLDYIKTNGKCEGKGLYEDEARNIFLEVAEGLRYLHNDVRLVHKDIKLDNILLDKEGTWKICDFGLTEFQNSVNGFNDILYNSIVGGSLAYCAPEQLRSPTPLRDPSGDVWSLGVVLFAMVTGQLPFSDSFEPRLQYKIINGRYDESLLDDSGASDDLRDLLNGMFKTKPTQRLTISEVLEHRWCER